MLRKDEIHKQIEEGWQSAKRGEFVDGDRFFGQLEREETALESSLRPLA